MGFRGATAVAFDVYDGAVDGCAMSQAIRLTVSP
jgi:hypothetical protein